MKLIKENKPEKPLFQLIVVDLILWMLGSIPMFLINYFRSFGSSYSSQGALGGLFFLTLLVGIIETILLVKIRRGYKNQRPNAAIRASVMGAIAFLIFVSLKIIRSVILSGLGENLDVSILQKIIGFSYLVVGLVYFPARIVYLARQRRKAIAAGEHISYGGVE